MVVILPDPEVGDPPYPVYDILHGLSDDHTIWQRRTRIEWYVRSLPLIVVMPDGARTWYTDAVNGYAGERAIMEDVIGFVDRMFPTVRDRSGRAIGGLSMGGYGAMKLALKYPDRFCSVNSHSGALNIARALPREEIRSELCHIFGEHPEGGSDDVFTLAERLDPEVAPRILFDCGVDDFLIDHNRAFHAHLNRLGIPHTYVEHPGIHSWDYWDKHVQEALEFHSANLGLSPHSDAAG